MATLPTIAPAPAGAGLLQRVARESIQRSLGALGRGRLSIVERGVVSHFGGDRPGPEATMRIHDPSFWADVASGGTVGAGEAYIAGSWSADDLVAVMRLMTVNREVLEGLESGVARLARGVYRVAHAMRRNSRGGSRRNIRAHYDLGNDFFALFLDPTMMYSCGIYEREGATLEEAQIAKLDRICRRLELKPGDHLLEIGTGWGAMAIHAAREYGCRVTTTTISRAQHDLARERIDAAGLGDRIELVLRDYRDLEGQYDKLVSIEMIEAVGHEYYDAYFATVTELLRPDGLALIQAITIADDHYERVRRGVDFIKRYIFPGSCIPSTTALLAASARSSDLRLVGLDDLTPHYAKTLRDWRHNLLRRRDEVAALGHGDAFLRTWEYYFALCEGGFAERYLGDVHYLFARPDNRRDPRLSPVQ